MIICETVHGIYWHLRKDSPSKNAALRPLTLCGLKVGWDIKNNNLENVTCYECKMKAKSSTRKVVSDAD